MDIIEELFYGYYSVTRPTSEEFQVLQKEEVAFWDYIEKTVGLEYLEAHFGHRAERERLLELHIFREGLRLGMSLMMELF